MSVPQRSPLRALRLAAAALALATAGCAAQSPRKALVDAHTGAHVYHHARDDVARAARAMLAERGFEVIPTEDGEVLRTKWRLVTNDAEFDDAYLSYRVVVHRLTREHSRVTAVRLRIGTSGLGLWRPRATLRADGMGRNINTVQLGKTPTSLPDGKTRAERDLDFEWELLRRVEPVRARQIGARVDDELAHPHPDSH